MVENSRSTIQLNTYETVGFKNTIGIIVLLFLLRSKSNKIFPKSRVALILG